MDVVDRATRSRMMAGIRGKNTRPEMVVRSMLHREGFRFRLHSGHLPGRPDVLLRRHRVAVFVHGCFWHRHTDCKFAASPKTRPEFWSAKLDANVRRDQENIAELMRRGWRVLVIWECVVPPAAKGGETLQQMLRKWILEDVGSAEIAPRRL